MEPIGYVDWTHLESTLVLANLQQFHDAPLVGSISNNLTNNSPDLHMSCVYTAPMPPNANAWPMQTSKRLGGPYVGLSQYRYATL
jgi:hypothetical protein